MDTIKRKEHLAHLKKLAHKKGFRINKLYGHDELYEVYSGRMKHIGTNKFKVYGFGTFSEVNKFLNNEIKILHN